MYIIIINVETWFLLNWKVNGSSGKRYTMRYEEHGVSLRTSMSTEQLDNAQWPCLIRRLTSLNASRKNKRFHCLRNSFHLGRRCQDGIIALEDLEGLCIPLEELVSGEFIRNAKVPTIDTERIRKGTSERIKTMCLVVLNSFGWATKVVWRPNWARLGVKNCAAAKLSWAGREKLGGGKIELGYKGSIRGEESSKQ